MAALRELLARLGDKALLILRQTDNPNIHINSLPQGALMNYVFRAAASAGARQLVENLKVDELKRALENAHINHGSNNPNSKTVLKKRFFEQLTQYHEPQHYFANVIKDKSLLDTFCDIMEIESNPEDAKEDFAARLEDALHIQGMRIFLDSMTVSVLRKVCDVLGLGVRFAVVSNKKVLIDAIMDYATDKIKRAWEVDSANSDDSAEDTEASSQEHSSSGIHGSQADDLRVLEQYTVLELRRYCKDFGIPVGVAGNNNKKVIIRIISDYWRRAGKQSNGIIQKRSKDQRSENEEEEEEEEEEEGGNEYNVEEEEEHLYEDVKQSEKHSAGYNNKRKVTHQAKNNKTNNTMQKRQKVGEWITELASRKGEEGREEAEEEQEGGIDIYNQPTQLDTEYEDSDDDDKDMKEIELQAEEKGEGECQPSPALQPQQQPPVEGEPSDLILDELHMYSLDKLQKYCEEEMLEVSGSKDKEDYIKAILDYNAVSDDDEDDTILSAT